MNCWLRRLQRRWRGNASLAERGCQARPSKEGGWPGGATGRVEAVGPPTCIKAWGMLPNLSVAQFPHPSGKRIVVLTFQDHQIDKII